MTPASASPRLLSPLRPRKRADMGQSSEDGKGNFRREKDDIIAGMASTAGHAAEDEHFDGQMSLVTPNLLDNPAEYFRRANGSTF